MKRNMKFEIIAFFLFLFVFTSINSTMASSRLKVNCDLEGAEVFLNEKFKGECPIEFEVSSGKYKVIVRKDLDDGTYYYYERETRIGEDVIQEVNAKLERVVVYTGQLRHEPLIVSYEERNKVFKLDKNGRPLTYIENDFEELDDVVIDHATGLMWQKSGLTRPMDSESYINEINQERFAGYNDWRLPTVEELMSLWEESKQSSSGWFINPIFDKSQSVCGSADKNLSGASWIIYFEYGKVDLESRSWRPLVRAVRSLTQGGEGKLLNEGKRLHHDLREEEIINLYDTAMYFVHSIEDKGPYTDIDKFSSFIDMTTALASVNNVKKSEEAFNNALAILHSTDLVKAPQYYKELTALAKAGELDKALKLASYGEPKDSALRIITSTLVAENKPDKALMVANSIEDQVEKSIITLQKIIPLFVEAGRVDKAMECLSAVEKEAVDIKGEGFKKVIAIALARVGRVDEAITIAEQNKFKASILANAAYSLAESGNREKAQQLLEQALNAAKANEDIYSKMLELGEIAFALVQVDNTGKKVNNVLERIVSISKLAENVSSADMMLSHIARRFLELGRVEEAVVLANSVTPPTSQSVILADISNEFVKRSKIDKAIEVANSIQNVYIKATVLFRIAAELVRLKDVDKAVKLIYSIDSKTRDSRAEDLMEALEALVESGHIDRALELASTIARKEFAFSRIASEAISLNLEASQQKVIADKIMTNYLDAK